MIALVNTNNFSATANTLQRSSSSNGRGIGITEYLPTAPNYTHSGEVHLNTITGNLMTGINVSANISNNIQNYINITNNTITRNAGSGSEDHGIYAQTAHYVKLERNNIRGWSNTSSGHGIKLRNSDNVKILSNSIYDSGIIMPGDSSAVYPMLTNITVHENTISCGFGGANTGACIAFARNWSGHIESNISITRNVIWGGAIGSEIYIGTHTPGSIFVDDNIINALVIPEF